MLLFKEGGAVCLYLRLPGGGRLLVDGGAQTPSAPLDFLRRQGELGPLTPLGCYLRPNREPELDAWLRALSLVRGLVLRPGGAWVFWRRNPAGQEDGAGYSFTARVAPRGGAARPPKPPDDLDQPPLLVLGLSAEQVRELGGPPAAWAANASLAMLVSSPEGPSRDFLLGGDLRAGAWQSLLADPQVGGALHGASYYAAGEPARGFDLSRGLLMACLPWLVLGALAEGRAWPENHCAQGRVCLSTPPVGVLCIDVDREGALQVSARPRSRERLAWDGLLRPMGDPQLPAPWPLRRALAGA